MRKLIALFLLISTFIPAVNTSNFASADEVEYFILCKPEGEVNVRKHAKIRSDAIGGIEFGKSVTSDGKRKNGFTHVIDLAAEDTSGWVSEGYLITDEPVACDWIGYIVANGRVMARKNINGKRTKWLEPGSEVIIHAYSSEWCVTEYGFIRTEFIEIPQSED